MTTLPSSQYLLSFILRGWGAWGGEGSATRKLSVFLPFVKLGGGQGSSPNSEAAGLLSPRPWPLRWTFTCTWSFPPGLSHLIGSG